MKSEVPFFERVRQRLDFPLELLPGQLQIILGRAEVTVYAHRGIGSYCSTQIQVRVGRGYVLVTGENLEISRINTVRLQITGQIHTVSLEDLL